MEEVIQEYMWMEPMLIYLEECEETEKPPKFCSQYRRFSEVDSVQDVANTFRKHDCATSDEIVTLAC